MSMPIRVLKWSRWQTVGKQSDLMPTWALIKSFFLIICPRNVKGAALSWARWELQLLSLLLRVGVAHDIESRVRGRGEWVRNYAKHWQQSDMDWQPSLRLNNVTYTPCCVPRMCLSKTSEAHSQRIWVSLHMQCASLSVRVCVHTDTSVHVQCSCSLMSLARSG